MYSLESVDQEKEPQNKGKVLPVTNLITWPVAYSRLMAVLFANENTSKEAAGLAAHLHIILQLHQDLGGNRWLKYDVEFCEWATAKCSCVG